MSLLSALSASASAFIRAAVIVAGYARETRGIGIGDTIAELPALPQRGSFPWQDSNLRHPL